MTKREKKRAGEGGFTLVELLVVVAILGVLIAIVLANFTGLLSGSQATAGDAELNIVQTAMDVKMANENQATVTAITTATDDMTSAGFDLYPDYMRGQTSKGTYTLAANGTVTQVTTGY